MHFASDNWSGAHPKIMAALTRANDGYAPSYGGDALTKRVELRFAEIFEREVAVFFVATGGAANSLALSQLSPPWGMILCHEESHIQMDECGAPEFFSNGAKLLVVQTPDGKLSPEGIRAIASSRSDIHFPKPRVVTITQPSETGQVYKVDEVQAISAICRELGLRLHMDGARFAHACATLDCAPADITWRAGVDVLCFGGTKNGMAVGDAIIFFDRALAEDFGYRCKQAGQLASKMRFLAAPWVGMLESGAWLRNAQHGNACAQRLASKIKDVPGVATMFPVEANTVFVSAPAPVLDALRERGWRFYTFIGEGGCRLMCAWDTRPEDVSAFAGDLRELMADLR